MFFFVVGFFCFFFFFFQAEDGIRDAQESRGLGDVYKRQAHPVALPIDVLSHLAERDEARLADIKHALKEGKSIKSTEDEDGLNDMDDPSSNLFSSPFYTILRSSEYDFNQAVASEIEFKKQAEGGPLSRREEELASLYEKQVMELKRQLRARDTETVSYTHLTLPTKRIV
eukprot:TRINITY_DN23879_c0_g1_i1.p1 TRINITY_DN23879_c0_g1~~TRINITY_DN23879_c0_g1_i1.p1  ORF type:complete len:171 (-),score=47.89 TRINITY_DN23879_c0_g1_i1:164-676(-)